MGYAETLTVQDGRQLEDFELVAWDGSHISFELISLLNNRLRSDWNQPNPWRIPFHRYRFVFSKMAPSQLCLVGAPFTGVCSIPLWVV